MWWVILAVVLFLFVFIYSACTVSKRADEMSELYWEEKHNAQD